MLTALAERDDGPDNGPAANGDGQNKRQRVILQRNRYGPNGSNVNAINSYLGDGSGGSGRSGGRGGRRKD